MIIDSPIVSGSSAASGSLNQIGNVTITGSLNVTGDIVGNVSGLAASASYSLSSSYAVTASSADDLLVRGVLTAQTLVVQTITSSVDFVTGSTRFGTIIGNTHQFTGSVGISGSLDVNNSSVVTSAQTSSLVALSASYAATASYAANVPETASYALQALTSSYALTASYISGSGMGVGFPYSGAAVITGSLQITNLTSSGTTYLVADSLGNITAQTASAAIKTTQEVISTAGQTSFNITNGYTTGLVDVFINGTKLSDSEFTDTTGTVITLATGSNDGDVVEFVKYLPASGVSNNVLRQLTSFTATAGQMVFSASYTPGLLDVYYNGARLTSTDYTANNGVSIALATASLDGDILDVMVYSYQVGAMSGIGGSGVAGQVAYYGTTNSITGSPNFSILGNTMNVTGSLIVSGSGTFVNIGPAVFSGSVTAVGGFSGSFSGTATSASYAATASSADSLLVRGTLTAQTLVVQTITSSVDFVTGSTRFGTVSGNTHQFTGSMSVSGSGAFVGNVEASAFKSYIPGQTGLRTYTKSANVEISSYQSDAGSPYTKTTDIVANADSGVASQMRFLTAVSGNTPTTALSIASTGAATFSNSVTAGARVSGITQNSIEQFNAGGLTAFSNGNALRYIQIGYDNTGNFGWIQALEQGTAYRNLILNGAGGNVGIGTSSPSALLHINGGAYGTSLLITTSSDSGADLTLTCSDTGGKRWDITSGGTNNAIGAGGLQFYNNTDGVMRMGITSAGNVGIGTSTPQDKLDVNGSIRFRANTPNFTAVADTGVIDYVPTSIFATDPCIRIAAVGTSSVGANIRFQLGTTTSGPIERLRITTSGVLGFNSDSLESSGGFDKFSLGFSVGNYAWIQSWGGNVLYINKQGNAVYAGTQRIDNNSDARLKDNIESISGALDTILSLKGRKFNMLDENGKLRYGFVAQEVQPHLGDFVTVSDRFYEKDDIKIENLLTLETSGASWAALLVEAIKEQQTLITALQEKLERNNIQ